MHPRRIVRGIALLALTQTLAGCSGSVSPSPSGPSPVPQPSPTVPAAPRLFEVTLSGVVSEMAPTGLKAVPGVDVYCEACGEGHTFRITDSNGLYSFSGVWMVPGVATQLQVFKQGYTMMNADQIFPDGWGFIHVMVEGDTRFDIQLVPR